MIKTYFALYHFLLRRIFLGFSIPSKSIVLDLGSGDKPFWRADFFVDDLTIPNFERAGNMPTLQIGFFVDANAESLPFEDNTFDFVYCSHLLEHVGDPQKVIQEIIRVTKSTGGGYIETPNALIEMIAPFPGHRWLIFENKDGCLDFLRQSNQQHDLSNSNQARLKLLNQSYWNGYALFNQIFWSKDKGLNVNIHNTTIDKDNYNFINQDLIFTDTKKVNYYYFVNILRKIFCTKRLSVSEKIAKQISLSKYQVVKSKNSVFFERIK